MSFKNFVAGIAPDTQNKIAQLKEQLAIVLGKDTFTLKVVDVLEKPELAEEDHILATPTMVRHVPEPIKKIILNFNNQDSNFNIKIIKSNEE